MLRTLPSHGGATTGGASKQAYNNSPIGPHSSLNGSGSASPFLYLPPFVADDKMDTECVDTQAVVVESGHDSPTWRKLTRNNFASHASYVDLRQRSVTDMGSVPRTDRRGRVRLVLEDVPHFSDYLPDSPTYPNPLQDNPACSVVKLLFRKAVQGGSIFDEVGVVRGYILSQKMFMLAL
ncbi:hypothetical protein OPV22_019153 [Ensete ventricosum]|uniref:Uncharacterized protein n=1 Tax=Ensete ventricosum TaxID=4639 RepID=A0AAV8R086_ENSVE|nr:hypothetical protein OPV22_019153 [Ensete ventricosum]